MQGFVSDIFIIFVYLVVNWFFFFFVILNIFNNSYIYVFYCCIIFLLFARQKSRAWAACGIRYLSAVFGQYSSTRLQETQEPFTWVFRRTWAAKPIFSQILSKQTANKHIFDLSFKLPRRQKQSSGASCELGKHGTSVSTLSLNSLNIYIYKSELITNKACRDESVVSLFFLS